MSALVTEIRPGAYADSIVLMQLQSDLQRLDGVLAAGVVMGAAVNLDLLRASDLLDSSGEEAAVEDLIIAVRADSQDHAIAALAQIDSLMQDRKPSDSGDFRPRSLAAAARLLPAAHWVSISIPGRHAPPVAREALDLGCNVFLYSDNVGLEEEVDLKEKAEAEGRLLMGPDCGSAIIGGIGFGFSNAVHPGPIGLVCASGTGLQAITSRVHQLGSGISHAIGTGGRDLSSGVQGTTARQALDLLARDDATQLIVLTSKPPDASVRAQILAQALQVEKPIVVYFSDSAAPVRRLGNLHLADSLTAAAETAVAIVEGSRQTDSSQETERLPGGDLRGLFAGGTLALEALRVARLLLWPLQTNLHAADTEPLDDLTVSTGHTILDLGADEFTVGRLHPMMDQRLRIDRLRQEAADPTAGTILLDVVLGRGAHPDPAAELEPVLEEIRSQRSIPIVVLVVGTDEDIQDLGSTVERLTAAGAKVFTDISCGLAHAVQLCSPLPSPLEHSVESNSLSPPRAAINVGVESFYDDLLSQGLEVVQVDWRPPAGGNERLMAILEKMKT